MASLSSAGLVFPSVLLTRMSSSASSVCFCWSSLFYFICLVQALQHSGQFFHRVAGNGIYFAKYSHPEASLYDLDSPFVIYMRVNGADKLVQSELKLQTGFTLFLFFVG